MDPKQAVFDQFLAKFSEGKSEEEIGETLKALFQFESDALYTVMTQVLTDEDFDVIEKIDDDTRAEQEIESRFQMRTGMNAQEFVNKLRDSVSAEYLKKTPQSK